MRFMMLIKGGENAGPPSSELMEAVGKHAMEIAAAGILLDMGGLLPSWNSARIRLSGGKLNVTDGPFTEAKEVVGGYAILRAGCMEEAKELGLRFMEIHQSILGEAHEIELEIRPMFDAPADETETTLEPGHDAQVATETL